MNAIFGSSLYFQGEVSALFGGRRGLFKYLKTCLTPDYKLKC